ncbi:PREDICTED: histidine-rich glycoprotein isoform X2 [Propithecus coquereli]|uniref:histidine-rich glycoprotein isoform X2 n=1 Tax=Propithecus coquereli TaxID=379532 RepID=UPI00063F68CB|nr:PREDICTED: histidine-rich glycoprotein isoform X2 [Propithecus coquereli]
MKALTAVLLLVTLQYSCAVSPTDCNAAEPEAEKALDLINKWRRDGYLFQLLRVADAHLDAVVIGQCKVIATRYSSESQDLRLVDFNCTTSSVSSALANNKDSPVVLDFFEDTELYRNQANQALEKYKEENGDFASFRVDRVERVARARGGERTNYYVEFSVRNCSRHHFPRHHKVFAFCKAVSSYDVEDSDLGTPKDLDVNCEVFNPEEHPGHHPHFGGHGPGKPPFKPNGVGDHHHPHKPHGWGCPPPPEGQDHPGRPPLQAGAPPPGPRCPHHAFGINETQRHPHDRNSSEHRPDRQHPHGHRPHGRGPHGHDFHPYGPCDPPVHNQGPQDHHRRGHGPPPRPSEEKGPGKGHFPFHRRPIGYVYRLPPLNTGEVLPLPEANFPIFSLPNQSDSLKPFPQSASESCPGTFKNEVLPISKFFAYTFQK